MSKILIMKIHSSEGRAASRCAAAGAVVLGAARVLQRFGANAQ
jgi:hypothetical protein